jgi:hypothetical protein
MYSKKNIFLRMFQPVDCNHYGEINIEYMGNVEDLGIGKELEEIEDTGKMKKLYAIVNFWVFIFIFFFSYYID